MSEVMTGSLVWFNEKPWLVTEAKQYEEGLYVIDRDAAFERWKPLWMKLRSAQWKKETGLDVCEEVLRTEWNDAHETDDLVVTAHLQGSREIDPLLRQWTLQGPNGTQQTIYVWKKGTGLRGIPWTETVGARLGDELYNIIDDEACGWDLEIVQ